MPIIVNNFTPSVEILDTDKIAQTDDKIRVILGESKIYLEKETQSAVTQMESAVDTKLVELAANPGVTYTPEVIDQKVGEMSNASALQDVLVAAGTNKMLLTPVSFTKITVQDGAILKLL